MAREGAGPGLTRAPWLPGPVALHLQGHLPRPLPAHVFEWYFWTTWTPRSKYTGHHMGTCGRNGSVTEPHLLLSAETAPSGGLSLFGRRTGERPDPEIPLLGTHPTGAPMCVGNAMGEVACCQGNRLRSPTAGDSRNKRRSDHTAEHHAAKRKNKALTGKVPEYAGMQKKQDTNQSVSEGASTVFLCVWSHVRIPWKKIKKEKRIQCKRVQEVNQSGLLPAWKLPESFPTVSTGGSGQPEAQRGMKHPVCLLYQSDV